MAKEADLDGLIDSRFKGAIPKFFLLPFCKSPRVVQEWYKTP